MNALQVSNFAHRDNNILLHLVAAAYEMLVYAIIPKFVVHIVLLGGSLAE
jgi:hypothetical protein